MTFRNHSVLRAAIEINCLRRGDFTLASGKKSSYYLDLRLLTTDVVALRMICESLVDRVKYLLVDSGKPGYWPGAVGGMPLGAAPLVFGFAMLAEQTYVRKQAADISAFLIRKEAKQHGTGGRIFGDRWTGPDGAGIKPHCLFLEDVSTTGASLAEAIEIAQQEIQAIPMMALTIVDRLEGARERIEPLCRFESLFTIRDFGIEPNP
jgi:orotate phosphoribosyltransferase